jgi:beta-glucosidase
VHSFGLKSTRALALSCYGAEHEGADRTTLGLPAGQLELLQQVKAAAKGPVVVVLVHGGPLSSDWAHAHADAVLDAIDGGQSAGTALASVLFGETNPSGTSVSVRSGTCQTLRSSSWFGVGTGMLPYTLFPEAYASQNDFTNMSMRASPGRTYRFFQGEPLWPFGG